MAQRCAFCCHLAVAPLGTLAIGGDCPLLIDDGRSAYTEASVVVDLSDKRYVLSALELTAVGADTLRHIVGSLLAYEYEIRRALDRVFTGF